MHYGERLWLVLVNELMRDGLHQRAGHRDVRRDVELDELPLHVLHPRLHPELHVSEWRRHGHRDLQFAGDRLRILHGVQQYGLHARGDGRLRVWQRTRGNPCLRIHWEQLDRLRRMLRRSLLCQ